MSNSLEIQIQERLRCYVAGNLSLTQFEEWFVPATWDVEQTDDAITAQFTSGLLLLLAEYSNGDWIESEMNRLLAPFLETDPELREQQVQNAREQVYFVITGTRPVSV